jgi:hypothetical protein
VLIPSLYATSLRTGSLRPVRVPSDQNTRWRLPVHILPIRDKNSLSLYICQIDHYIFPERVDDHAATPYMCGRMANPLGTLWIKFCFCLIIMFYCLVCVFIVNMNFLYLFLTRFNVCTYLFMHCIELPHASHALIFVNRTQASKLGGGLMICLMTIGQGSDAWNTQLISECLLGNGRCMCLNHFSQRPYIVFTKIVTGQIWDLLKTR